MFKLKYAKMCNNEIFDKYGIKPVIEDYFKVESNAFCIADGVTRDSIKGEAVPYPENEKEVKEWIKTYPNPSGSYLSAKICAETFLENINKNIEMLEIVKNINKEIWKIKKDRKIDYLKEDLYGCVAVGGIIEKNTLKAFSIGDCHIKIFDEEFNELFQTTNNHLNFENYLNNIYVKQNEYNWNNSKDRAMVRRDFRNKPEKLYNGKEISFGVLTGEKEAEHYIDTYNINLENAKYIVAYSDGCEPFFNDKETIKTILTNPKEIEKEGKERTLIVYEKGEDDIG